MTMCVEIGSSTWIWKESMVVFRDLGLVWCCDGFFLLLRALIVERS